MPPKKIEAKVEEVKEDKKAVVQTKVVASQVKTDKNAKNAPKQEVKKEVKDAKGGKEDKKDVKGAKQEKKDPKQAQKKRLASNEPKLADKTPISKDTSNPSQNKIKAKQEKPEKEMKDPKEAKPVKQQKQKLAKPEKQPQTTPQAVSPQKLRQDRSSSKSNPAVDSVRINKMERGDKPHSEQDLIRETGLLEAYELFLRSICKYGLPSGDIYEFAAQQIEKYERKKRARELKIKAEIEIRKAASKKSDKLIE